MKISVGKTMNYQEGELIEKVTFIITIKLTYCGIVNEIKDLNAVPGGESN